MCMGLFAPIKYFPVLMLACFALGKEWRVVLGGVVAIAGVALVSISVLGWQLHQIFLLQIFGNHLTGHLSLQDQGVPLTAVYQSFDTLFNRLFVFDPLRNPQPLLAAPLLRTVSLVTMKGAIALAAVATLVKLARGGTSTAVAPSIGILGILVLLIAPATATYMCVLLWLPVALLIDYFLARGARMPSYFILGAYTLIGFIPWRYTYPFEGRGGLTVLAYPRLLLLFAMFVGCVWSIVHSRRSGLPAAPLVA
jgi:hypothetical protein